MGSYYPHVTLGVSLNIRLAAVPLTLLLLAGCGTSNAGQEPEAEASSASASPTPSSPPTTDESEPAFQVSRQTTCNQLLGQNEDGPFYRTITFLQEFEDIAPPTIREARGLKEEIDGIALNAEDQIVPFLQGFAAPMTEMIEITESGGTNYTFVATEWKAAGTELTNLCTPYFTGTDAGADTLVEPVPISGVYEEDLAAVGVVPDDITSYAAFMRGNVCEGDTSDSLGSFRRNVRVMHDGEPSMGSGAEALRLTVAYFCPERAGALEDAITEAQANAG
ncbi:hypothetical protein [Arthrobacter zhaoguopingii]|uniref:hypothetical protein n=1 Tax=Arthrobacter zhaoguopingii TaxID=2681491 RepID=UPI00135C9761|nr:hypothetical protein [Arthrobacter zhaoguopingii]